MHLYKVGLKLLLSRKKWLLLIIMTLSITISSVLSIFSASSDIRAGLLKQAYDQYGEHSGILAGAETTKDDLTKKVQKAGEFEIIDSVSTGKQNSLSIEWMDNDAIELGHLNVLKGNLPTKENDAVIEASYLDLFHNKWQIGDTIKLKGEKRTGK